MVLFTARPTVVCSREGRSPGDILGAGAACLAIGAPAFGSQVCRVTDLVVLRRYEAAVFCVWEMLRGWVRA